MPIQPKHLSQLPSHLRSRRSVLAGAAGAGIVGAASVVGGKAQSPVASPAAGTPTAAAAFQTTPIVFQYDAFNFDFLVTLGGSYERTADIGECYAVAAKIEDGNIQSWVTNWRAMADRLHGIGATAEAAGRNVSASEAYLRASNYYSAAQWYTLGTPTPDDITAVWTQHRDAFESFLRTLDRPTEKLEIPYQTDLPLNAYAILVDDSNSPRPWVLLTNGSDGGYPWVWSSGGAAALRRGYNVLIYDGPGQNAMLFEKNTAFIADWETVLTPIVDDLLTRTDVDPEKLVLTGGSQGGYWAPRAAAFEHRLAAVVADPGVVQVWTSWVSQMSMSPEEMDEFFNATDAEQQQFIEEIDQGVQQVIDQDPYAAFATQFRMYPYRTDSFGQALLMAYDMDLTDLAKDITTPILITDPEGESFWPGQSEQLYSLVGSERKSLARFTAAEGADLHCEPKAMGLRNQFVFDWLDETLGR